MAMCRSCEKFITWVTVKESGKTIALDEQPDPKGGYVMLNGQTRRVTFEDRTLLRPTYTCHFDTCEDRRR